MGMDLGMDLGLGLNTHHLLMTRKEVLLRQGPLWPRTLMATFSWIMSMTQLPMTYTNKVIGELGSL